MTGRSCGGGGPMTWAGWFSLTCRMFENG